MIDLVYLLLNSLGLTPYYYIITYIAILLIFYIPTSAIMSIFFKKHISLRIYINTYYIISLLLAITLVILFMFGIKFNKWSTYIAYSIPLFDTFNLDFTISIKFVTIYSLLLLLVLTNMVLLFANEYLAREYIQWSTIQLLFTFTGSVIFFMIAETACQLFFFWEMAGFLSYQLLIIYTARLRAASALNRAYSIGRASDTAVFLLTALSYALFSTDYVSLINTLAPFVNDDMLSFVGLGLINIIDALTVVLIFASICKSAQFICLIWLPDAMEAPTPASALIHSSTLVIMGIVMMFKYFPLLVHCVGALKWLTVIASFTVFYGSFFAAYTQDFKRAIAYSTIAQIGYIYTSISLLALYEAFAYLLIHALCKAAIFVIAGYIIHLCGGYTSYRKMGALFRFIPHVGLLYIILVLTLAGMPLLSALYIKEMILLHLFTYCKFLRWLLIGLWIYNILLSVVYSHRMIVLPLFGIPRMSWRRWHYLLKLFSPNWTRTYSKLGLLRFYNYTNDNILLSKATLFILVIILLLVMFENEFTSIMLQTAALNFSQFTDNIFVILHSPINLPLIVSRTYSPILFKLTIISLITVMCYTLVPQHSHHVGVWRAFNFGTAIWVGITIMFLV